MFRRKKPKQYLIFTSWWQENAALFLFFVNFKFKAISLGIVYQTCSSLQLLFLTKMAPQMTQIIHLIRIQCILYLLGWPLAAGLRQRWGSAQPRVYFHPHIRHIIFKTSPEHQVLAAAIAIKKRQPFIPCCWSTLRPCHSVGKLKLPSLKYKKTINFSCNYPNTNDL